MRVAPDIGNVVERRLQADRDEGGLEPSSKLESLSRGAIALVVAATFGSGMALVVPLAFSLALRLSQVAPGHEAQLGYVLGAGQLVTLIAAPLTGVLSDRTRTRWGRRTPFTVGGLVLGLLAIPLLALAKDVPGLALGWILTTLGWGTVGGSVGNLLADRLPRHQRGTVSGLSNLASQVAPVVGVLSVAPVSLNPWPLFLIPGVVGGAFVIVFVVFVREPDSRAMDVVDPLSLTRLLKSYAFNPRRYPNFAWAWAARFTFFFGLSLTTGFSTYFYAQRLDVPVSQVAPTLALMSALGVVAASLGSVSAGWVSDRWGTRQGWTAAGAVAYAAGCMVSAAAYDLTGLMVGSALFSLGLAVFGAVGGALTMDILPERRTQAGRYLGVNAFSQKIPATIAPLAAPALLSVGGSSDPDYGVLYLIAAACAVVGALIMLARVRTPERDGPDD